MLGIYEVRVTELVGTYISIIILTTSGGFLVDLN